MTFLLATLAPAQVVQGTKETDDQTLTISGNSLTLNNASATQSDNLEMIVGGGPATVSASIAACGPGGTCTTVLTTTSTSNVQLNPVSTTGPVDHWLITGSWTGGSSPTLRFRRTASTAGGAANGANVTANQATGTNLHTVVDNTFTVVTGTITTTQTINITVGGAGSLNVYLVGPYTGNVVFEATVDGITYVPFALMACPFPTVWLSSPPAAAVGAFCAPVGSWKAFQVRGATVATGSVVVTEIASQSNPTIEALASTAQGVTNVTNPAGMELMGGLFNTARTNITNGNMSSLQMNIQGDLSTYVNPATVAAVAPTNTCSGSCTGLTTAVVVKAAAGNLYGFTANNGAASVCFVEFINAAAGPTLGTAAVFSVAIPATSSVIFPVGAIPIANFATGISVGLSTTYNGAAACGTAGNVFPIYK